MKRDQLHFVLKTIEKTAKVELTTLIANEEPNSPLLIDMLLYARGYDKKTSYAKRYVGYPVAFLAGLLGSIISLLFS